MKSRFLLLSSVVALSIALGTSIAVGETPTDESVDFLPISISFSCQSDTLFSDQLQLSRSVGARPGVMQRECIDRKNAIDRIHPASVGVTYNPYFQIWRVVIILNDKDALSVQNLMKRNVSKRMVVGINGRAIFAAPLVTPIGNNRVYLSVDSQKVGNDMLNLFVDRSKN